MSVTVDVAAGGAVTVDVDENAGGPAGGVLSGNYPDPGFAVPMATAAELTAHEAAHPAHPASGVSVASGAGVTATDVQAAIAQIVGFINSQEAGDSAAVAAIAASLADETTRATTQELLKLAKASDLADLADAAAARANLGLGTAATHPATDFDSAGAAAAAQAASIPLTQKGAAGGVASLDGSGLIPDTQIPAGIARDTEVASAVAALVASAPATLDTLNELATALGDDPNFATTMATALGNRLLWRGAWAATTAYAINDLVTFNGGLFRAPTAFTSGASFNQANWIVLVAQTGTYESATKLLSGQSDIATPIRNHASFTIVFVGYDPVMGVVWGQDTTNAVLRQSSDWATQLAAGLPPTWSNSKTVPATTTFNTLQLRMVRFGNYVWCVMQDSSDSTWNVYRATPQAGSTAFNDWTKVFTFTTGTSGGVPNLHAGSQYLFAWEYGDPVGGPHVWRISLADANGAGTNFTSSYTDATIRHIHAVREDPDNPGQIWCTRGDGVGNKAIGFSSDHGATWADVASAGGWQAVGIDFSAKYVHFFADKNIGSVWGMDRVARIPKWLSKNWHFNLRPPTGWRKGGYNFTDLVTTSGSPTVTSATGAFVSRDTNRNIAGAGIPFDTQVTFVNSTTLTLSANATATATGVTFVLSPERYYSNAYFGAVVDHATGASMQATTTGSQKGSTHGLFYLHKPGDAVVALHTPPESTGGVQFAGMGDVIVTPGAVLWNQYMAAVPTAVAA